MSQETKLTYVTLLADPSIHPKYEAALKQIETEFGNIIRCSLTAERFSRERENLM